jgi:ribosomal protein S9
MAVYLTESPQGKLLVNARTNAQAVNHVVKNTVTAKVVTAEEAVKLMQDGVKVESAGEAPQEEAAA